MYVRMYLQKDKDIFLKTKSFPKKTIVFVKNFKTFLKKLEEFSENFKVFSKGTLQPFIIALNFHIPWIGFILDFNLSLNRKNTLILFVKRIIAIKQ